MVAVWLVLAVLGVGALEVTEARVSGSDRIFHGSQAAPGEFPHQVSIQTYQKVLFWSVSSHFCGGTILSERWVLTAGHCYQGDGAQIRVVAGTTDLKDKSSSVQRVAVDKWIVHEDFVCCVGPLDLSLLHLEQALVFNQLVRPAKLPVAGAIPSGPATMSGWGYVNNGMFPTPRYLQKLTEPVMDWNTCNETVTVLLEHSFSPNKLNESNVCTSPGNDKATACSGDSGGPLIQQDATGDAVLIGAVSWGFEPCGRKSAPSVFTRVSAYVDWITQHTSS